MSSCAGSKAPPPPQRPLDLERAARDELVHEGALPRPGPQQPPDPLDMLARAQRAARNDGDVRVGDVEPLVEHPRGYERGELSQAEARQRRVALGAADV